MPKGKPLTTTSCAAQLRASKKGEVFFSNIVPSNIHVTASRMGAEVEVEKVFFLPTKNPSSAKPRDLQKVTVLKEAQEPKTRGRPRKNPKPKTSKK